MSRLLEIGTKVRERTKVPNEVMTETILRLCASEYVTLAQLAKALGRERDTLRVHYLNPLVQSGKLSRQYPAQQNHPKQAYKCS